MEHLFDSASAVRQALAPGTAGRKPSTRSGRPQSFSAAHQLRRMPTAVPFELLLHNPILDSHLPRLALLILLFVRVDASSIRSATHPATTLARSQYPSTPDNVRVCRFWIICVGDAESKVAAGQFVARATISCQHTTLRPDGFVALRDVLDNSHKGCNRPCVHVSRPLLVHRSCLVCPGDTRCQARDWPFYKMNRMRSFSFPRLSSASSKAHDNTMSGSTSPYSYSPTHSRESSGASAASTPVTPTFSNRSHGHWHNSSSSLATTPESPVNVTKSPLHDLVEDPEEREDGSFDAGDDVVDDDDELCICDTPFCEHQWSRDSRSTVVLSPNSEWTPGDDSVLSAQRSFKRSKSGEAVGDSLGSRISRRWPSVSKHWRDYQATASMSNPSIRSAPASRSSSLRLGNAKRSFSGQAGSRSTMTPPFTPLEATSTSEIDFSKRQRGPPEPLDIRLPQVEDPVDRQELASTPLLPPTIEELVRSSKSDVQSPLQSPKVAGPYDSFNSTPHLTPVVQGIPTPPLSSKPSIASFQRSSTGHLPSTSEIPPMAIGDGDDRWAARLGHANFHIHPAPYFPEQCDSKTCARLRDDWETARMEYMRQAARASDCYGPTSQIFRLMEQKWAEIDATWRANHELAKAQAGVNTNSPVHQALAETAPLSKMPSLNDPQQPAKFPQIDDADIVGPMVQYAKVQRRPSKRVGLLRLFTDPASLLGRSTSSLRR